MAKKPRAGNSYKTQYKAYVTKNQWRKNKIRKLVKRVNLNKTDNSALLLLDKNSKVYGRAKPGSKGWFHPQEQKLIKIIGNSGSTEEQVSIAKTKLSHIQNVYRDKKSSAIQQTPVIKLPDNIPKQLYNLGLINAKRYKSFKPRVGGLRRG